MSLLDALARRPDGTPRGVVLTWLEVARFLRDTVWNHDANKERKRKAAAAVKRHAKKVARENMKTTRLY